MNHPQAQLKDILGHTYICIFKERFKYDPCRSCDGLNRVCENYLASKGNESIDFYHSKIINTTIQRNETQIAKNEKVLRPFYWYHSSITKALKPRIKDTGTIWTYHDGGVI